MTTERYARFADEFARVATTLPGARMPWLARARRSALDRFARQGLPTPRDEAWKYTNVAAIEKRSFTAGRHSAEELASPELATLGLGLFPGHRLVFVNGTYAPSLSAVGRLPAGVALVSLADALDRAPDTLESMLSGENDRTAFAALNTAFMADGAYLHLPRGATVEEPIHLFFIATATGAAIYPRNVIVAGERARTTVIEHYAGREGAACFTDAVTQIVAAANASVDHYKLQHETLASIHIAGIHANQGRDSRLSSHSIALGAAISRNDITTTFDAEGCEATLNGLFVAHGRQHVDHHTCIDHAKPNGTSREYYRGLLDGASRGVFNGKIVVHPQAQHTDAHQANHNLLLSKDAEVDTQPQLEIYADDVKCTHGATVGQLDDEQVFYLRSRGVDEGMAKSLLTYAFAHDVIERMGVPELRNRLRQLLLSRLPQGERIEFLGEPA
jgi:Fe-S cluster assembly protein SufD